MTHVDDSDGSPLFRLSAERCYETVEEPERALEEDGITVGRLMPHLDRVRRKKVEYPAPLLGRGAEGRSPVSFISAARSTRFSVRPPEVGLLGLTEIGHPRRRREVGGNGLWGLKRSSVYLDIVKDPYVFRTGFLIAARY
jgi:hypothetical protein